MLATRGGASLPLRWQSRQSVFGAEHAFTPTQILSTIGAFCNPREAQKARAWLRTTVPEDDCGFIFMRSGGALFPVGQQGGENLLMSEVLEAGAWGRGILDVAGALTGDVPIVSGQSPAGCSAITWKRREVVYLVFSAKSTHCTRLVSRLYREAPQE
jgi:hypothetical protein